ncbi:LysR family transcriptional regulator [Glaciecola sp. 2405UD65-10]|uniref:LysR family transcriptional regulator n=1 Tax=Glaciecola sp. 2405UD65-10 TaxID=3397244 RepID=UPI003B5AC98F
MRPQELNLIIIFDAIMTEGSISRAANRLSMTQPAVSNAVSRMRSAWKDDLFVKDGRNIKPTLKAINMWEQIKQPINELSSVIKPNDFDPATSTRTFRIAAADIVVQMMMLGLRQEIEKNAPGINVHMMPYTIVNTGQVLDDASVDLVIGSGDPQTGNVRSQHLFHPHFICAMRPGHPLAKSKLTLDEFAKAEHLLVSLSGDVVGVTDEVLAQNGLSRRIAMSVNQFSMVTPLLANSDLICVVPLSAISNGLINGDITGTLPPLDLSPPDATIYWHLRQDKDLGVIWLRQLVHRIIKEAEAKMITESMPKLCGSNKELCAKLTQSVG